MGLNSVGGSDDLIPEKVSVGGEGNIQDFHILEEIQILREEGNNNQRVDLAEAERLANAIKSGNTDMFPEYPFKAKDGSTHADMEGVRQANETYWDSMKIIPKDKYIIPILPQEPAKNLKIISKK